MAPTIADVQDPFERAGAGLDAPPSAMAAGPDSKNYQEDAGQEAESEDQTQELDWRHAGDVPRQSPAPLSAPLSHGVRCAKNRLFPVS